MNLRFPALTCLMLCASMSGGQAGRPVPPGVREADKLSNPAELPPQVTATRPRATVAELEREANELAKLAQLIPSEIDQVKSGRLPKDLDGQLKRIEKLSKKLRREISR